MSQREPTEPYVYQPGALAEGSAKLWGVSGPGAKEHEGKRYTKAEAEAIVRQLKLSARISELVGDGGRRCPKCGGQMAHYRLYGYRCWGCS